MFTRLPRLARLFLVNALIGCGLAMAFTALLIVLDVANLGHLILTSPQGWLAVVMLVWFFTITFGSVQIAIRVMALAERDEPPTGGRRQRVTPAVVPVAAAAARRAG